jgi:hypothetical protein
MSPVPLSEIVAPVGDKLDTSELPFLERPLIHQLRKGWPSVALGIIIAGGGYPLVLAAISLLIGIVFGMPSVPDLLSAVVFLLIYPIIWAPIGLVWTNVVVVMTLPAVFLVVWSLHLRGSILWCGAFWGGLVGFIAVLPIVFIVSSGDNLIEILAMGPAITTMLGQLGGAWGGRRAIHRVDWYQRALNRASVNNAPEAHSGAEYPFNASDSLVKPARFQFGIRHLLWSAVWISVLLSLLRLLGAPLEVALPILGVWAVYQAATLWMGGHVLRRVVPWWVNRQATVPRGTTGRADAACAFHVEHAIGRSLPDDVTREVVSRETGTGG